MKEKVQEIVNNLSIAASNMSDIGHAIRGDVVEVEILPRLDNRTLPQQIEVILYYSTIIRADTESIAEELL